MVFLVLFAQVWSEYRFNRNFEGYKNIYRFELPVKYDDTEYQYTHHSMRPVIEELEICSPGVLVACDYSDFELVMNRKAIVNENGSISKYDVPYAFADSSFPDVFKLNFIAGSAKDFNHKNDVIIAEKHAGIMFGDDNPIGKSVTLDMSDEVYRIVGIYETLPENCTIINGLIINEGDNDLSLPNHLPHVGFFRLNEGTSADKVLDDFRKAYGNHDIRLTPIADIHFLSDCKPGRKPYSNKSQTLVLLSISLLFLVISIFNYVNFSIASIPFKINDINIEKVFGASRKNLIFGQLKYSTLICLSSFALAVAFMELLSGSEFAAFSSCSLAVEDNITAIIICLTISLTAATIGAVITAVYSISFTPGMVLKGAFAISSKGVIYRRISLIAQFVLSYIFMICGITISRQTDYMVNKDNGFVSENIVHINSNLWYRWHKCFNEFLQNPEIMDVTCGNSPMEEDLSSRSNLISHNNKSVYYSLRFAHHNYFDFFDFELTDGRFPKEDEFGVALINETFAQTYPDYKIGNKLSSRSQREYEIIGVVKDFNARPLMHKTEPMVYNIDNLNYGDLYFKIQSDDMKGTIEWIKKVMRERIGKKGADASQIGMTSTFLDDDIVNMYRKEIGQAKLITYSSVLCLIIALIGVLGIVYFETQVMKKEIAIRKVNGATTLEMISRLSGKYILLGTISFIIALPFSIMLMKWWLSGFAYSTDIAVWIFILSYLIITTMMTATVIIRSWSAASENPITALKLE